jgi:hypothetical protein
MKYMLFMSVDKSVQLDPDQRSRIPAAVEAWVAEMDSRGVRLQGDVLAPTSNAKTVRVRNGEVQIGDGPLGEVQISGYNILDCSDIDEGA